MIPISAIVLSLFLSTSCILQTLKMLCSSFIWLSKIELVDLSEILSFILKYYNIIVMCHYPNFQFLRDNISIFCSNMNTLSMCLMLSSIIFSQARHLNKGKSLNLQIILVKSQDNYVFSYVRYVLEDSWIVLINFLTYPWLDYLPWETRYQ